MKKIILVVLLASIVGCYDDGDKTILPEEKPSIIFQIVIDGEFRDVENNYTLALNDCHNDAGPCGGSVYIKSRGGYIFNVTTSGPEYTFDYLDYPYEGNFMFYYSFVSRDLYSGFIKIETDDPYYSEGFILNFTGEKY
jgi:hypothetical protein